MGMTMIEAAISVIGAALLGIAGWAVHLNSRVAVLEADKITLKEWLALKLEGVTERLTRIEQILDKE
jgi:hypothetical protein